MKRLAYHVLGLLSFAQTVTAAQTEPVVIKMGTVIATREGIFPHHMLRAQEHLARQIERNTNGQVILEVLDGGREDISPRDMTTLVAKGDVIQAANLNTFFFPKVPELLIQSIPFLFTGAEHSRRFPTGRSARRGWGRTARASARPPRRPDASAPNRCRRKARSGAAPPPPSAARRRRRGPKGARRAPLRYNSGIKPETLSRWSSKNLKGNSDSGSWPMAFNPATAS